MSERECDNPKPSDVLMRCDGTSLKVALCDDTQVCLGKTRLTPTEYAAQQCAKFTQHVPSIDPNAKGMQAAYSASTSLSRLSFTRSTDLIQLLFSLNRTTVAIMRHLLQTL